MSDAELYTEANIAAAVAQQLLRDCVVCVPNTKWTGYETDVLAVHRKTLLAIDAEIKISRADLRADRDKRKWRTEWPMFPLRPHAVTETGNRTYMVPPKIWKHVYVVARPVWTPELLADINPMSGVFTVTLGRSPRDNLTRAAFKCERRSKTFKDAVPLSADEVCDLARLVTLRYWNLRAPEYKRT